MGLPLAAAMHRLQSSGSKAFIPFLTAGYPDLDTFGALLGCTRAADFVEVGLPFSDPVADGPSICHASEVALAQGMHADRMFELLAAESDLPPVVVMTYLNPVLAYGAESFMRRAGQSGVRGIILTDVPPEDAGDLFDVAARHGIASVLLVAPTTSSERIAEVAARTTGFLYCVAVTGTTGAREQLGRQAEETVARLRQVTPIPVVVGFGISTPTHVRQTCRFADGV
ncbi:MAG: tryptophan synthase subunit alpha, partial [Candidatus Krumholzibacteriia bacterium]